MKLKLNLFIVLIFLFVFVENSFAQCYFQTKRPHYKGTTSITEVSCTVAKKALQETIENPSQSSDTFKKEFHAEGNLIIKLEEHNSLLDNGDVVMITQFFKGRLTSSYRVFGSITYKGILPINCLIFANALDNASECDELFYTEMALYLSDYFYLVDKNQL